MSAPTNLPAPASYSDAFLDAFADRYAAALLNDVSRRGDEYSDPLLALVWPNRLLPLFPAPSEGRFVLVTDSPGFEFLKDPSDAGVYFIQRGADGPVKIGFSRSAKARLGALQTGVAERLVILAVIVGDRAVEREMHSRFSHLRVGGEWFRPAPDLLGFIAANAGTA